MKICIAEGRNPCQHLVIATRPADPPPPAAKCRLPRPQCSCGTADHFKLARPSDKCDVNYHFLCTGDATVTCGGEDAIRVYHRTNEDPSPVPDIAPPPDTNDGNDVDEDENVDGGNDGGGDGGSGDIPGYKGCFKDKKRDRAMNEEGKNELNDLTNQVRPSCAFDKLYISDSLQLLRRENASVPSPCLMRVLVLFFCHSAARCRC